MIKYKKREFCIDKKCLNLILLGSDEEPTMKSNCKSDCPYSAGEFHDWLQQKEPKCSTCGSTKLAFYSSYKCSTCQTSIQDYTCFNCGNLGYWYGEPQKHWIEVCTCPDFRQGKISKQCTLHDKEWYSKLEDKEKKQYILN